MHVKALLSTIFICLIATPIIAIAQEITRLQPVTTVDTETVASDVIKDFDLVCQSPGHGGNERDSQQNGGCGANGHKDHGQSADNRRNVKHAVDMGRQKLQNSASFGCDEPGDVFEQGVCLD